MLFMRYGSAAENILQMQFEEGLELIAFAAEQKTEEMIYQRWLLGYEKLMSLDEFKAEIRKATSTHNLQANDTKEEILDKVKAILETEVAHESI